MISNQFYKYRIYRLSENVTKKAETRPKNLKNSRFVIGYVLADGIRDGRVMVVFQEYLKAAK